MEVLHNVVVLLHLIGFAVLFGAWVAEAAARRFQFTTLMNYGILISSSRRRAGRALAR